MTISYFKLFMKFYFILKRDIFLLFNNKNNVLNILFFFLITNFLIAFSLPKLNLELNLASAVAALISTQIIAINLSKRWVFERDYELKILQQIYLSDSPSHPYVIGKILSNYLIFNVPMAILSPIILLFFGVEDIYIHLKVALAMLVLGILTSTLNVMISSVSIGLKNGGTLGMIISIPLLMPIVILFLSYCNENNFELQKLISGAVGIEIIYLLLSLLAGKLGIAFAARD